MSGQDQTTANKPTEPRLCKMGCGFFGNGATEDCCSKCWREMMKKQGGVVDAAPSASSSAQKKMPLAPSAPKESAPEPMDVEPEAPSAQPTAESAAAAVAPTPASAANPSSQTKKKKASYKNMMASMMKQQSMERDLEKEKEALRKVTGGGAFSKIDKI